MPGVRRYLLILPVIVLVAGWPWGGHARAQAPEGAAQTGSTAPVTANQLLQPASVTVGGPCDPSLGSASSCGVATAYFNRVFIQCESFLPSPAFTGFTANSLCLDPTTGGILTAALGSILNGTVFFTIADPTIAAWVDPQPTATQAAPSSTAGFVRTASQVAVRCGFFPTTTSPFTTFGTATAGAFFPGQSNLISYFGGCDSASATYRGLAPGMTLVTATFVPDLAGAFGAATPLLGSPQPFGQGFTTVGLPATVAPLLGLFAGANQPTASAVLTVIGAAPAGTVPLTSVPPAAAATVSVSVATGCNNVTPTVTEPVQMYAARVRPPSALVAIWEHQAATNSFRGAPGPGAPATAQAVADLTTVTRLRPVFVCVSMPATLDQPAA